MRITRRSCRAVAAVLVLVSFTGVIFWDQLSSVAARWAVVAVWPIWIGSEIYLLMTAPDREK